MISKITAVQGTTLSVHQKPLSLSSGSTVPILVIQSGPNAKLAGHAGLGDIKETVKALLKSMT